MVRQVKVSNFTEVQGIVSAAAKCYNEVGVHDMKGSIADAKSILGMMSLDYSHPVKIVCEDEGDLRRAACRAGHRRATMPGLSRPCIGIIAQLFPHSLCIMHKTDFFHFLHKRPKSSFWRFGEFAHILGSCWQRVHLLYVFWKYILCF